MPGSFFDSNVLIYVASGDAAKADQAEHLIARGGAISVQVLNEVANIARRKMRLSWQETGAFLATMRGLLRIENLTLAMHETGIAIAERHGIAIYDAMIVAAALHADCDTLWSEDMENGLVIDERLRIVNPFFAAR